MLPYAILAHGKAHKTRTQMPTLPRAKNANALPHPPGRQHVIICTRNTITPIKLYLLQRPLYGIPNATLCNFNFSIKPQ